MAGQKKATKLEYLKQFEKFKDNDIILIDTRKDKWIRKIGEVTPLDEGVEEPEESKPVNNIPIIQEGLKESIIIPEPFTMMEREAIVHAKNKAKHHNIDFDLAPLNSYLVISCFIGSKLNASLFKQYGKEYTDKYLVDLYNRYKKYRKEREL